MWAYADVPEGVLTRFWPDLVLRSHYDEDGRVTEVAVVGDAPVETTMTRWAYGSLDRDRLSEDGRRMSVADGVVYELGEYLWGIDSFVIRRVT